MWLHAHPFRLCRLSNSALSLNTIQRLETDWVSFRSRLSTYLVLEDVLRGSDGLGVIEAMDASDVPAALSVLVENFAVVPGSLALVPVVLRED